MTVGHGWEAKLTGEVPILGRVIERLGLIIRILCMVNSGFFLADVSDIVVKVVTTRDFQNNKSIFIH